MGEALNGGDMTGLERVGTREINFLTCFGEIYELNQGISHPMHSGDYYRFFSVITLAAQNCRDLAVALRIAQTRAPELVNYPS